MSMYSLIKRRFKIVLAFRDKPGVVNVDGFRNESGSDFSMRMKTAHSFILTRLLILMHLSLTHAEFGYQADFLQENAGLAFEGSLSWFLALVCCGIKSSIK